MRKYITWRTLVIFGAAEPGEKTGRGWDRATHYRGEDRMAPVFRSKAKEWRDHFPVISSQTIPTFHSFMVTSAPFTSYIQRMY